MSGSFTWNDRPVVFGEFNIRQGRAVRAAYLEDGERGSYVCLALSMRYADTNEPVFASADEIEDQVTFRLQQRIIRLAAEAARVNGLIESESETPKPNGHDGEERPSL